MESVLVAGRYLTWGVVSISLTNLLVVVFMVVAFVVALLLPFPGARRGDHEQTRAEASPQAKERGRGAS